MTIRYGGSQELLEGRTRPKFASHSTIGFDRPETHAIRKDQTMYYAFFAKHWKGTVELRGLKDRKYSVVDYVTGKNYGTVSRYSAHLPVDFDGNLLVEVRPQ